MLGGLVVGVYSLAAGVVGLYSLGQLHLLVRSIHLAEPETSSFEGCPSVLVQLPIRNERCVVQELLRSMAQLDWPKDALVLQVLDDSDDDTTPLCAEVVEELREEGFSVQHVRRPNRTGFKAGALAYGLTLDDAPFVAVFDADFRPHPDFLRRTTPHFADERVGLVQARWGHLNRDASLFTRSQAFHLDAHFTIEQRARSVEPLLMGFNGTGGVWRRSAIEGAGGWSADTLTEDLDLAFRAQLAGWQVRFVDTVEAPAELPADVRAIRTQQHRWMKGGAQVGRKLLTTLWASERPLPGKLQGTVHLLGGTVFFAVFALLLTVPLLGPLTTSTPAFAGWLVPGGVALQLSLAVLVVFYGTMCVRREGRGAVRRFLRDFLPFLALSTGLAAHNSLAVLEGWAGIESPFVRTPKVGNGETVGYAPLASGPIVLVELALGLWGLVGFGWAVAHGQWILAGFLVTQALGCIVVALGSGR